MGSLTEGVETYTDRTHVLHNIPDALEGADVIQMSNGDKNRDDLEIEVTVLRLSVLYVALDDRHLQPTPGTCRLLANGRVSRSPSGGTACRDAETMTQRRLWLLRGASVALGCLAGFGIIKAVGAIGLHFARDQTKVAGEIR